MSNNITFNDMLNAMSNPAKSALLAADITSYPLLAALTAKEVLCLHGIGKASLPVMNRFLEANGYSFKE